MHGNPELEDISAAAGGSTDSLDDKFVTVLNGSLHYFLRLVWPRRIGRP